MQMMLINQWIPYVSAGIPLSLLAQIPITA